MTAKAFGLGAIDLVCVNYKDPEALRVESEEGRRLGFTGKVRIPTGWEQGSALHCRVVGHNELKLTLPASDPPKPSGCHSTSLCSF